MMRNQQRRNWLMVGLMTITCALVLAATVPGSSSDSGNERAIRFTVSSSYGATAAALQSRTGTQNFVAILPLLVVGVLSPLCLFAVLAKSYVSRTPQAPALAAAFERPPPRR